MDVDAPSRSPDSLIIFAHVIDQADHSILLEQQTQIYVQQ